MDETYEEDCEILADAANLRQPIPIHTSKSIPVLSGGLREAEVRWGRSGLALYRRQEAGIRKYGVPLNAFNGRDAMADLYQELCDALMYVEQLLLETSVDASREDVWDNYTEIERVSADISSATTRLESLILGSAVRRQLDLPFAVPTPEETVELYDCDACGDPTPIDDVFDGICNACYGDDVGAYDNN